MYGFDDAENNARYYRRPGSDSGMHALGDVLQEVLKKYRLSQKFEKKQALQVWNEVVGHIVAARTKSLYIEKQKLFVEIESPALRQEIQMLKDSLIARLNEKMQADAQITEIIIR
ncbi:MAG: DUF721 domain-containing protein [Bernardetiaceae bacterium]|nr:DUF721 domain-containing protein [Bernardetiaceae bacterium]